MKSEEESVNLSETLFNIRQQGQAKETSALIRYMPSNQPMIAEKLQEVTWYRHLRRLQWAWQGVNPVDQERVLSKIAASSHSRTTEHLIDTVMGYHGGNWAYEWSRLGMEYQGRSNDLSGEKRADTLFNSSLCFSIAGYPHIKGDNLALQSQVLAHKTYLQAIEATKHVVKTIEVPYKGKRIQCFLHLPHTERPLPVVIVSGGLDSLQTDMWRLYRDYLAKEEIAMLTVDMPSIGTNNRWSLTEDASVLHQMVLDELPQIPWVDHYKVGLLGFRFGGNVMVRLSHLEQRKLKACVTLGAPVHHIFNKPELLKSMPKMFLDVLSSRLGKEVTDIHSLVGQMQVWSLKTQGFLSNRKTQVPTLALSVEGDMISPHSDNLLIAIFSDYGKAKRLKQKSLTKGYDEALKMSVKWLKEELNR
ncbi:esterase FrsA [Vibrio sp.]|nr:esterase FrsA [Vibrio sp.]